VRPAGFKPGDETIGYVETDTVEDECEKEDAKGFHG